MTFLAARFADQPALVAPHMSAWATECLHSLEKLEKFEELMITNTPVIAASADSYWPPEGSWLSAYRPYNVVNGTLLIPVKGLMMHELSYQIGSYATGYAYIAKALERGLADRAVDRIAFVINSGGGDVAGVFDLVDKIHAARSIKPMVALVNEHAYSAAYAIASATGRIITPRTGGVGSIGVVTSHIDASQAMAKQGYTVTFIFAGKHKVDGNSANPLPDSVKKRMQVRIDALYNVFAATTARNLDVPEEAIRATEALTYGAEDAIEIGLVHEIASFDDALAAFIGGTTATVIEEITMATETENTQAASAAELAAARAEGSREGATAERARIQGILALDEASTRKTQAFQIAMKTDMSVEAAKELLASFPEEKPAAVAPAAPAAKGDAFEKAMAETPNPEVGASAGNEPEKVSAVDQILADYRAATGSTKH